MAAARSPSPGPSRPSSPNPNAIESTGALRKSGAFNLSKSWSVSEISHRKAVSKSASALPSVRTSFEKENDREPNFSKQARGRSPAIDPSKGTKSFMAPTISAASKITAASPRKKVLAERNQVVRGSTDSNIVSAEEVKVEGEIRRKSEIGIVSEELSSQNRSRKLDFSISKDHHQLAVSRSHSLDIGPQDAGPSLPPYDPMKNYLSPRPRFLHYKPNPRIEQHQELREDFLYAADGRRLEDSFSDSEDSENSSDTVEDDTLMKAQEVQFSDETYALKPKLRYTGRSKFISFVVVLAAVSCIPLTDSPVLSPIKMNDLSFTGPRALPFIYLENPHFFDYLDVASRNMQRLAAQMMQWSMNFIENFYFSGSFSKELDMFHFFNTSSSSVAHNSDLDFCYNSNLELAKKKSIINGQNGKDNMEIEFQLDKMNVEALARNDRDVAKKVKVDFSDEEDLAGNDTDSTEKIKTEFSDEKDYSPKYERFNPLTHVLKFETMLKNDQPEKTEIAMTEEIDVKVHPVELNIAQKVEEQFLMELVKDQTGLVNTEDTHSSAHPIVGPHMTQKKDFEAVVNNFLTELEVFILSEKKMIVAILGVFATAALVLLFIKQKQTIPVTDNTKSSHQKSKSVPDATNSCRHGNRDVYCSHWGHTEMVSDSGPTEMSSSFNNSLCFCKHRSQIGCHPVTPSPEIVQRRESGVSSSFSYGSFTSFEKRSARKGVKDEEVMTPVRRSSRIRNQISSP